MSIQRYGNPSHDYMTPAHADGFLVLYADHVAALLAQQNEFGVTLNAAVAAARDEERQRINSMLVVDYVREQYERGAADKAAELQDFYGEQAQGHYNDGYKMGYAKGLIEGDSGGRKEGYRAGYDTAWSLSAVEIERATEARVREEEQAAQTLARAELYSMEEMDERCTQAADEAFAAGVKAARDAVAALPAYYAIEECQGNPLEKGDPEDPDPWKQGHLIERDDALAAIDALRETT